MYNTILTQSMIKGAGKTIGSLAIFGVVALGWYVGEAFYKYVTDNADEKKGDNSTNVYTQTKEYFDPQALCDTETDTDKFKMVLNNLIL